MTSVESSAPASETLTAATPATVISARDLSIRYPSRHPDDHEHAVNGATFDLVAGEILALAGETGSGKSALAATLAGHAATKAQGAALIHGGSATVLGYDVRALTKREHDRLTLRLGYLPQNAGALLAPRLTIGENIAEPIFSRDRRFNQATAGAAVASLIDAVRLPMSIMNRYPHELSRGQRQRVAIAKSLILEPVLLIADDPTSGIDVMVRAVILDIIRELQKDRSFSALIVTTDLGEIERITDRVLIMQRGVIVGNGKVDEVFANPSNPYVAGLAQARRRSRGVKVPEAR